MLFHIQLCHATYVVLCKMSDKLLKGWNLCRCRNPRPGWFQLPLSEFDMTVIPCQNVILVWVWKKIHMLSLMCTLHCLVSLYSKSSIFICHLIWLVLGYFASVSIKIHWIQLWIMQDLWFMSWCRHIKSCCLTSAQDFCCQLAPKPNA